MPTLDSEPVLAVLGAAGTVVSLGLVALKTLGVLDLDPGQTAAIVAFIVAVSGTLIAAVRGTVYSPETVAHMTHRPGTGGSTFYDPEVDV